jgi:DNA-binding response OmpR family regulator
MSLILLVEDERHIAEGVRFNLELEGHETTICETGEAALETVGRRPYELILLDVMLPGIDGFSVAKELRNQGCYLPILMLTARGRAEDVVSGFEAGADDYLPKPFDLTVLIARVTGLLRRVKWSKEAMAADAASTPKTANVATFGEVTIDFGNLELRAKGELVHLTVMELNLLRYLMDRDGQVVSRKMLLEEVWGLDEGTDTRAIDNFIVRLRKYIEPFPALPRHLLTVRGVGYRFVAKPEE